MNLTSLKINGFRAFPPGETTFNFNQKNAVVVGDNGTGKSSVLAAIEFLLCGNLTHLSGEGTSALSIAEHAPHQHAAPEDCYVEGEFQTRDGESGKFRRYASDPQELESVSGSIESESVNISQWNDDHLILTRGELLEFIEATPNGRGNELSKLLNLNGVSNRTKGFEWIRQEIQDRRDDVKRRYSKRLDDIESGLEVNLDSSFQLEQPIDPDDEVEVIDAINEKLEMLDADCIENLSDFGSAMESIQLDVTGDVEDTFYQSSVMERVDDFQTELTKLDQFGEDLNALSENLEALEDLETEALEEMDLVNTASRLVDSKTRECPLCGEIHDEGFLAERIRRKLEKLSEIEELKEKIDQQKKKVRKRLKYINNECREILTSLEVGIESGDHDSATEDVTKLRQFKSELDRIGDVISDPLVDHDESDNLQINTFDSKEFDLDREGASSSLSSILGYMDSLEPRDKYTDAHADLVLFEEAWENLQELNTKASELNQLEKEIREINNLFEESKRESLSDLYSSIESNFNEYYTTIHPDEDDVNLSLDHEGTESVDIKAKHGNARDSPLAFHSEGHIDTMGICLFLALRDELNTGGPNIVLFDDIVMSIDKNHRRGVARMLDVHLDDSTQAILATHDEVWSDQLQGRGVVPSKNITEISDWDLSTGPIMSRGNWELIQNKLDKGEPHSAAAHLRRSAEKFGMIVALKLKAPVDFKERYSLGDYVNAINTRISDVASSAKRQQQQNSEQWETAKKLDDKRGELWGQPPLNELNRMIHYNREQWGQLSAKDLQDVLDTWKEIDELVTCGDCDNWLSYSRDGDYRWIQCDCRNIQFGYDKNKIDD